MSAMESDQEAARLRTTVSQLEEQIAKLKRALNEAPVPRFQQPNPIFSTAAAVVTQENAAASAEKIDAATNTIEEVAGAPVVRRKAPPPPPKPARESVKLGAPATGPPPVHVTPPPVVPTEAAPVAVGTPAAVTPAVSAEPVVDERFAKFVKMQKMLPEGAVRQKMMTEGFNQTEIDNFFTNGPPMVVAAPPAPASATPALGAALAAVGGVPPPPPATANAAPVPDERFAKFVKMQKMLPEGAVRQKMMTEGFNQAEIDSFFTNGPPMVASAAAPVAVAVVLAPEPDERYAKYVKMQKMLPEGAVRQKMASDGFTPAEVDSFFTNGPPMVAGAAPAPAPVASAEPVPDERFAKFVKMQKMLPEGAVRQKMMTEGFNQSEIDSFFTNGPPMVAGAAPAA